MGLTDLPKYAPPPSSDGPAKYVYILQTTWFINFLKNQDIEGALGNAMDMK